MSLSHRTVALIGILASLGLSACGSDSGTTPSDTVALVTVTPATVSLKPGDTEQLTATPRAANGTALIRDVAWSSSRESVATVSTTGLVTAVDTGTATITATSEGKQGQVAVTVGPPVGIVEVIPATATLTVGGNIQLQAKPRSAAGVELPGRDVTWASSNSDIATVSTTGRVTAVALGEATITARSEGIDGTASITVATGPAPTDNTAPSLESITIEPDTVVRSGTGDTVVVTLRVTDAGSGVQNVIINLISPSGIHTVASVPPYSPTTGTRADGEWVGHLPLPADAELGDWRLTDIILRDVAGNVRLLNTAALQAAGFPTIVHVRQ